MHDYARKPRGRKIFSGSEKEAARCVDTGGKTDEERKGARTRNEKVESKGNEIMYATGTRAFSLSLFLSLLPLAPFSTPFFHLSNLNAHRRLSSPRLAVFSTEITSELMDLWQAMQRGRLNLSTEFHRLCTHRCTAQLSAVNTRIRNIRR